MIDRRKFLKMLGVGAFIPFIPSTLLATKTIPISNTVNLDYSRKGKLIIVTSPVMGGLTTFLFSEAVELTQQNKKVVFINSEHSEYTLFKKYFQYVKKLSAKNNKILITSSQNDYKKLIISTNPLFFENITSLKGIDYIFIDAPTILPTKEGLYNREQLINSYCNNLKKFALDNKITIVLGVTIRKSYSKNECIPGGGSLNYIPDTIYKLDKNNLTLLKNRYA